MNSIHKPPPLCALKELPSIKTMACCRSEAARPFRGAAPLPFGLLIFPIIDTT